MSVKGAKRAREAANAAEAAGLLDSPTVLLGALDRYIASATLDELRDTLDHVAASFALRAGSRGGLVLAAGGAMRQCIEAAYGVPHRR